jgi:deazaflavin-dependent oxidoreductase (nitroreductase family)
MPSDRVFKAMNVFHRTVLAASGGHLGWHTANMPVLKLTTTGRKSGQARSVMLTTPAQDGDAIVIVASRGGDDRHPAWYLNVQEHPDVDVVVGGQPSRHMLARVATAEERCRLWPQITAAHHNYADYQTATTRQIPLVMLRPAPPDVPRPERR